MVGVIEDKNLFSNVKVIFDCREDDEARTQWLSQRCNSIGGSEIAKIAGYSKYGSAFTVFNDKMGIGKKFKGNIHTVFGNRMEPLIREWIQEDFKKSTGVEMLTFEYPYMMVHKDIECFSANIDGLASFKTNYRYWENRDTGEIKEIPANKLIGIEIKTASEFLKKMWAGEEIPDEYYCQCQWYMGITGLEYFLIVYLLGKEVKWKVVPRNQDDIDFLFKAGKEFWTNNILPKIAPEPTGLKKETEDINYMQCIDNDLETNISDSKLERYNCISGQLKALEKEKEQLKQLIFLDMGDSKKGTDGMFKVSRFEVIRENIDSKKLKELYPGTYDEIKKDSTTFVNMRISKLK